MRPLLLAVLLLSGCKTVVVNCPPQPDSGVGTFRDGTGYRGDRGNLIVTPWVESMTVPGYPSRVVTPYITTADCKPGECPRGVVE